MFWFPLLLVFLARAPQSVSADQYAYNSRAICNQALEHLPEGTIVISFCSLCDSERVEIWRIQKAFGAFTNDKEFYEVTVFAKKLFQSKPFDSGSYQEPVKYERLKDGEESLLVTGVDLAYIYVARSNGKYRVLAKELKLKPLECRVKKIRLPKAVAAELKQVQPEQPSTTPSAAHVQPILPLRAPIQFINPTQAKLFHVLCPAAFAPPGGETIRRIL